MNSEKVTQLVLALVKMTDAGEIHWEVGEVTGRHVNEKREYWTCVDNKYFRLLGYEYSTGLSSVLFRRPFQLELWDSEKSTREFIFPDTSAIEDLYKVVEQTVGAPADQFVDKLIEAGSR